MTLKELLDELEELINNDKNYDYDTFGAGIKMIYKPVLDKFIKKWRDKD